MIQIGGVYTTFCYEKGILLQKYRDRSGSCIAILFKVSGSGVDLPLLISVEANFEASRTQLRGILEPQKIALTTARLEKARFAHSRLFLVYFRVVSSVTLPALQKTFAIFLSRLAWGFGVEKWRGFSITFQWSLFPRKQRPLKSPQHSEHCNAIFWANNRETRRALVLQLFSYQSHDMWTCPTFACWKSTYWNPARYVLKAVLKRQTTPEGRQH